jgi:hypothetical protein
MCNEKAIDSFIESCLDTASNCGFQPSELEKLRTLLVVTRTELLTKSSMKAHAAPLPIPDLAERFEAELSVLG